VHLGEGSPAAPAASQSAIIDQLETGWKASPEQIARLRAKAAPRVSQDIEFEVEPENWDALRLYLAMQTQWRVVAREFARGKQRISFLVETGLDYGALSVATWLAIPESERVLRGLQTLEREALSIFNRQRERRLSHL
jgi:hypothetical protein